MITFLKVLDNLSAQEFVVPPDDSADQKAADQTATARSTPSALTEALQNANICEVVCVGEFTVTMILYATTLTSSCIFILFVLVCVFAYLCVGVSVLSSVLTPAVLLHYPKLQLGYYSMLAYVLSSSPEFILPHSEDDNGVSCSQHQLHQIASAVGKV